MDYTNIIWRDGQPYSEMYDDIYFSSAEGESVAGRAEFEHVFFSNNGLPARWHGRERFTIVELGLGSCLNCLLTIQAWLDQSAHDDAVLHYIAIEKYPLAPQTISRILSTCTGLRSLLDEFLRVYPPPVSGIHSRRLCGGRVVISFRFMDAQDALDGYRLDADAWYLDGFSPSKNPEMWSLQLFEKMSANSNHGATCSTYTAAGFVRRNMLAAGFDVSKVKGSGNKREMLTAVLAADHLCAEHRLSAYADSPWFDVQPAQPSTDLSADRTAIVIGGGIAGMTVAYALTVRGFEVTVIDDPQGEKSAGSANPAAIVYPRLSVDNDIDNELYLCAFFHACFQLAQMQSAYNETFWFDTGLLQIYDRSRIQKIIDRYGYNEDIVKICESFTACSAGVDKVPVEFVSAGMVLPSVLMDALIEGCGPGLHVVKQRVESIQMLGGRWSCRLSSGEVYDAEVMVVASGTSGDVCEYFDCPVDKVRGQMLTLKAEPSSEQIRQVINAGFYITPAIEGRHHLGATFSRDNMDISIDDDDNLELIQRLEQACPQIFSQQIIESSWAGFRYTSRDRVPVVGPVPDKILLEQNYSDIALGRTNKRYPPAEHLKGLFVSLAHGSRGFTTSFISAEIIASLITGEPVPVSKRVLDYLSPSRFAINDLKQR